MRQNLLAGVVVFLILAGLPAGLFGFQTWRTQSAGLPVIELMARSPQEGGFAPDHLQLRAGETVRLRITSPDVVHGFSIPELGIEIDEILPGKPVEVDVRPDRPGRLAFACIRWCGIDHWRMRGVIDVIASTPDASQAPAPTPEVPLYQRLGQDLDALPQMDGPIPTVLPSAERGRLLGIALPESLSSPELRQAQSPSQAFATLRGEPAKASLTDDQVWDLVALAWLRGTSPDDLATGKQLYARDCAACHGPQGKGNGPAGRTLPGLQKMDSDMPAGPADFTDLAHRLGASDAVLQGKLLRGGMGTGMPEFGSLFTDEQMWALVAYLRTFAFQDSGRPGPN